MTAYENVACGKLKLKGKPLDVKAGGGMKKKKKHKKHLDHHGPLLAIDELSHGEKAEQVANLVEDGANESGKSSEEGKAASYDEYMTPAERRYMEQRLKIDMQRMAKEASKSHRDRIQEFNQYLANLSEHYDIPKVGPTERFYASLLS